MADKWSTTAGKKVRAMCWRRDREAKAPCWICGQPIDYTAAPSSTPDSWEPDHYLPRSRHPEYALDPSNIRPSHKKCNRSRSNNATLHGLGNRSRRW